MFGLGFTEIIIIVIIAILFLGPDKLPSAMVDVAKFFRNVKNTIGTVKNSIEEEMNVSEIKEEALAYKKELLRASDDLNKATNMTEIGSHFTDLTDDMMNDTPAGSDTAKHTGGSKSESSAVKASPKPEKVTFEKKPKEDSIDV